MVGMALEGSGIYGFAINRTTSFGVQSKIVQIFSNVSSVILFPFLMESRVLLSIPAFRRLYCEIFFFCMVSHNGV